MTMVQNLISTVLKQAITTFTGPKEIFRQNLLVLKTFLDKVTASDVNLPPHFMTQQLWEREHKAPVTCVDIYDDSDLSMGIFILKPGMKLPLHDHPGMFGLIKVLCGTIKVTSFSEVAEQSAAINAPPVEHVIAEKVAEMVVGVDGGTCILEPDKQNLHEIESVDGPAAFLDILSPPYGTEIPNVGPRKCNYYMVRKEVSPQLFWLEEIQAPSWYWNDTFPYTGPELLE